MSGERQQPEAPAWDRIIERDEEAVRELPPKEQGKEPQKLTLALFAAAWAELVCIVGVCTLTLVALLVMGHQSQPSILPWALALGLLWWLLAASATVVVRCATPGMLMAGVVIGGTVAPRRIPLVLAAALLSSLLAGLPALLGSDRSALRAAAGRALASMDSCSG
jgi:hypothetical protein